jgi:cell division septation protein DedD
MRATRDRLLGLGLAEDQVVTTGALGATRFGVADLDAAAYGVEFAALAQRLQRVMSIGRGVSVYVTGRRNDPGARIHTALQLALAICAHGREVVVADADFLRPGLAGLVADPDADGIVDMVRFGQSTRTALLRPVAGGPWILPAGSFPCDDPSPFEVDALRSVAYRVSQVCDLALFVGPLPIRAGLHPLSRVCDHIVYASGDSESDAAGELFESIADLQRQSAHVLGVTLYAPAPAPAAPQPVAAPEWPQPVEAQPPIVPHEWAEPEPSAAAPPVTDWSRFGADLEAPPPLPPLADVPPPAPEPAPEPTRPARWLYEPDAGVQPSPLAGARDTTPPASTPAGAAAPERRREYVDVPTPVLGASMKRGADGGGRDAEYAFETEAKDSRWPVILVVSLVVLILGFVGWTLWNVQRARQLERSSAIGSEVEPSRPEPNDAAASGDGGATQPQDHDASSGPVQEPVRPPDDAAAEHPAGGGTETPTPPAPKPTVPSETRATESSTVSGDAAAASPSGPAPAADAGGPYAVHVASFKTTALADKEIASLAARGYVARAIETDLGSKGIWYRVYVGSFPTVAEASATRDAILRIPGYDFAQVRRLSR